MKDQGFTGAMFQKGCCHAVCADERLRFPGPNNRLLRIGPYSSSRQNGEQEQEQEYEQERDF